MTHSFTIFPHFFPIKCVVATCVLSKKWKGLWISSPVLNIHETTRQDQEDIIWSQETSELVNFIDRVLLRSHPLFRNDLPIIKKFCLDYDSPHDNSKISGWISTLIIRKIEELNLCLPTEFVLPTCLFTCETLTILKIEMAGDLSAKIKKIGSLRSTEAILFPRLKILHLKHMIFVDESLTAQLFSNSPVLEELMLTNCYMMKKKVLRISSASLKRLFVTNSNICSSELKIYLPNLQSLTYNGIPGDYVLMDHGYSSIVDAVINIAFEFLNERTKGRKARQCGLKNLLGGISNVKLLIISGNTLESLLYEGFFTKVSAFHNLRRLEVSSMLSCITTKKLIYLLLTLPNLEVIVIAQASPLPLSNIEYSICFNSTAKLKKFSNISTKLEGFFNFTILMFPKGSTDCAINFSS
ncbi:hypothetical protein MKX01_022590 [Papaver californicum]|nr:hypothetical protein MKX01_022590 [Papaver californicum]